MCGLIGCAGPQAAAMSEDHCVGQLVKVEHRGPDDYGYARSDGVFLGHTRLAIQDTSAAAHQPFMADELILTYNGELWNAGLWAGLQEATKGDTEVVARLLQRYGIAALDLFDGMWAVAWHDTRGSAVHLARDRWGKVPLYWATDGASYYWASEYKALPAGLVGQPVQPGWCMTIDPVTGMYVEDHWAKDVPISFDQPTPGRVLDLLRQGVQERLVGDRPIAFMLSGGLDSSLILALAAEQGFPPPVAYTAVYDPAAADLVAARRVAHYLGVHLVEVAVPEPTPATILQAVRTVEIPHKAQVEIALAHLPIMEQMKADGFAVCLSGEAADELFGGYGGMCIKAAKADDDGYRRIKLDAVEKMARGNFSRVNKAGMAYGVECRLPFMQSDLVELALQATKEESPPAKKLLKQAARLSGLLPDRIIDRVKHTFQGGTGIDRAAGQVAAEQGYVSAVAYYNHLARTEFGYIPKG